ncbi:MAG: hypothetical protein ACK6CU_04495, partial [Deltaproteobacteria bacterium]
MRGWALCVCLLLCCASARVRAQEADHAFCGMRAGVLDEGLERLGRVESGRTGQDFVVFSREVGAGSRYLVLVGLSAPTSALAVEPARIVGDEAPFRAGGRVALDFLALDAGELTISFRAPEGTRFHAAVFALVTPRAGRGALGARPAAVVGIDAVGAAEPASRSRGTTGQARSRVVRIGQHAGSGARSQRGSRERA